MAMLNNQRVYQFSQSGVKTQKETTPFPSEMPPPPDPLPKLQLPQAAFAWAKVEFHR